jgi:sigma-B regulation protein RsbU (phosphoserine phosphatase)
MTLFYLTVNARRDTVDWVRAGHDPAWLYDPATQRFEELMGPGMALGVEPDYVFLPGRRTGLQPGQVLVVGTDGIWEARNAGGEMFGRERFRDVIRRHAAQGAAVILEQVFQAHAAFTRGTRTEDDVTLVVVKLV